MNSQDPFAGREPSDRESQAPPPGSPPSPGGQVMVSMPDSKPVVTYAILGLTVIVYLLQMATQSLFGTDIPALYGTKVNELIAQGQYWRLFTPLLLHGSILHIGFNMYALWILGRDIERFYGRWRFLAIYIVSGFGGNVFSMIFTPAPSLGASTAIFGLFAAEGMFFFQNRHIFGRRSQQAIYQIIVLAAINFFLGLSPGIDNWGHLGGFLAGGMFAYIGGPVLDVRPSYPGYEVYDRRSKNAGLVATLIVFVFFSFLAAMTLYMRR